MLLARSSAITLADELVVDASAFVDFLLGNDVGEAVGRRMRGCALHAPAHIDAEVLSALGRLHRGGLLSAGDVGERLAALADAPVQRHELAPLLRGAWERRDTLRLVDSLYIELANRLGRRVLTTDQRLAAASSVAESPAP